MMINGAMNGEIFLAYVEQCLVPTLKRGDIVVMDNVAIHRVAGVREAIEAADATLHYLSGRTPDTRQLIRQAPIIPETPEIISIRISYLTL